MSTQSKSTSQKPTLDPKKELENKQAPKKQPTLEQKVYHWLDSVVIGLNLCPFAKKPRVQGQIKVTFCDATNSDQMLDAFINEMEFLAQTPSEQTDTSLFVVASGLEDFESYLDFLDVCQMTLENFGYEGTFQLASFHPEYQFEGTSIDDRENYTNRAPAPIIHLIREDSMSRVLKQYPNPETIPERNIETVESLTDDQITELFKLEKPL